MVPSVMLTTLALTALMTFTTTASALAKPKSGKTKTDRTPKTFVVIWGGGGNASDADAAAADFTQRGFSSSAPITKVLSDTVPGLNPGFHIAILGACKKHDAHSILRRARRSYPGVYLRTVPKGGIVDTLTCPQIKIPKQEWYYEPSSDEAAHITGNETVTAGDRTLTLSLTADIESNGEFVSAKYDATLTLKKAGAILDQLSLGGSDFSTVQDLDVEGSTIVLSTKDGLSDCKSDVFYEMPNITRRFSINGDKILMKEKTTKIESGMCGPNYEGSSPCSIAKEQALISAVGSTCEGATRSKCMSAIAKYEKKAEPVDCSDAESEMGGEGGGD